MGMKDGAAERRSGRLGDRAAGASPQGVHISVLEDRRPLALPHYVAEHQRVGAATIVVAGDAPRVEAQLERPLR